MEINLNGKEVQATPADLKMIERMAQLPPPPPDPTEQKLAQMQAQIDALLEGRTGA